MVCYAICYNKRQPIPTKHLTLRKSMCIYIYIWHMGVHSGGGDGG